MTIQAHAHRDLLTQKPTSSAQKTADVEVGEFLTFKLGKEEYGIDILRVQEVRFFEAPTHIANAPAHVLGVQNMRGVIVPIIDMRLRIGVADARYDNRTVIIVLNINNYVVGVVVDAVTDVVRLKSEQLRPAPEFNSLLTSDHLMAIGVLDDRMLILVDIEKLMTDVEAGLDVEILH